MLITKPTRWINSQIYFGMKLYMFPTIPPPITRSFSLYTQQRYTSFKFVDSFPKNCPKHVEIHSKINLRN